MIKLAKNMISTTFGTLFLTFFGVTPTAFATPAQIILIRHAEKPESGNDLSERGYERANALVEFFTTNPAVTRFGPPIVIYAASPKTSSDFMSMSGGSLRSIETVTPLAKSLGLQINTRYTKEDIQAIANEVLSNPAYEGRMVLICWEHKMIPPLAKALGASSAPHFWPDSTFDRAWVINFADGKVSEFQNLPQHLLPGDDAN